MPRKITLHIRPCEATIPAEEAFRLSILDVVVPPNYNTYAIIFKADIIDSTLVAKTFAKAIEATLRQSRHLLGTIRGNNFGDYSIVNTPQSSVKLVLQWLTSAEDKFPSYNQLEDGNFTLRCMENYPLLGVEGMPDSLHPDREPSVIAFQLNFIRGGFVLTTHVHHFALDMSGTRNVMQQIAKHCTAVVSNGEEPAWDEMVMDRTRFIAPVIDAEDYVDAAPRPPRHPEWQRCSYLLFHITPQAASGIKALATPNNEMKISTYDAVTALCWRIVARHRASIYQPDLDAVAIFGHPIDMRNRCSCCRKPSWKNTAETTADTIAVGTPNLPEGYQANALAAGLSIQQGLPLTLSEVISDAPMSRVASFIRAITNSVGQHSIEEVMTRIAPIRIKAGLDMPLDSLPPMSFTTTDWRSAKLAELDFGIGEAMAYRCLYTTVVENMMIIYPSHKSTKTEEQGIEVMLPCEAHSIQQFLQDLDLAKWFEYRGVEVE